MLGDGITAPECGGARGIGRVGAQVAGEGIRQRAAQPQRMGALLKRGDLLYEVQSRKGKES